MMEGGLATDARSKRIVPPGRRRFGQFELDLATGELRKNGLRVKIQDQPLRILEALIEQPGEVVTREDLKERLWPSETFVDFERSLNAAVAKLRQVLADSSLQPRYIETVARKGYRFIAAVETPQFDPDGSQPIAQDVKQSMPRVMWPWLAATLGALALLATAGYFFNRRSVETTSIRFVVSPPPGTRIHPGSAVSPDGRKLAFVAFDRSGIRMIWLRLVGSEAMVRLENTEGASLPFWSPDSEHIAFFAEGKLKRIPSSGGLPRILCDQRYPEGGTWSRDNIIVFSQRGELYRVSASGGEATQVLRLDKLRGDIAHTWPQFLPDGRRFLFYAEVSGTGRKTTERTGIYLASLDSPSGRFVVASRQRAAFVAPNYLLFVRDGVLLAQKVDLNRFQTTGEPLAVADNVAVRFEGIWITPAPGLPRDGGPAAFSVSENGVLLYHSGSVPKNQLVWYGRDGKRLGTVGEPAEYTQLHVSPDGRLVAVSINNSKADAWHWSLSLLDTETNVLSRLTLNPGRDSDPAWSPDSRKLIYASYNQEQGEQTRLMEITVGQHSPIFFYEDSRTNKPEAWSPDGRFLLYRRDEQDILILPTQGERKPATVLDAPFTKGHFRFSPDGRWLAYSFREADAAHPQGMMTKGPGTTQIYIAGFPSMTGARQVSTSGGCTPQWRADGKELYYLGEDGAVMSVEVKPGSSLQIGPPRRLFQTSIGEYAFCWAKYVPAADGQKFLIIEAPTTPADEQMHVVTNWDAAMRR